jgi:carbamoyl-phosphate synthase small subunit
MDLAKEVSTSESYPWTAGSWVLGEGHPDPAVEARPWHVVAYDFGVKRNILRMLADRGCRYHRGAGADARPTRCWR